MHNPKGREKKRDKKEEKSEDAKKEKEKERLKPFTVKDFIFSKHGLPLLKELDASFQEKNKLYLKEGSAQSLHKYMRALVRLYISWAQTSPLCGNKRNRAYTLLKEIEIAAKTQNDQPEKENNAIETENSSAPATPLKAAQSTKYAGSMDSLFENTTYDTLSFSMMSTTQTDTDAYQANLESVSDLLDISEESSEGIRGTRRTDKKPQ